MATIAEQLTSLANTKTAIKDAIVAKGVSVADTDTFASYADKIGQIRGGGGGVPATKFGVSIDDLLGSVDEYDVYLPSEEPFTFDATQIKYLYKYGSDNSDLTPSGGYLLTNRKNLVGTIDLSEFRNVLKSPIDRGVTSDSDVFMYAFSNTGITEAILPRNLEKYAAMSFSYMFAENKNLRKITFSSTSNSDNNTGNNGYRLTGCFSKCPNIQEILGVENITIIGPYGWREIFSNSKIQQEELRFNSLVEVTNDAFNTAFEYCEGIKRLYFPALTVIPKSPFGLLSASAAFTGATDLTEIHFRADAQAAIEATSRYSSKWGATNATIYFDL